jgi:hypothetical protein
MIRDKPAALDATRRRERENQFLAAGAPAAVAAPAARITKTIRLDPALDRLLKDAVYEGVQRGERLKESDVIDRALRDYFKL